MSRQRAKILAAGAILVAGFSVAILFFRQVRHTPVVDAGAKADNVILRQSFDPSVEEEGATPHLSGRIEPITSASPSPPTVVAAPTSTEEPAATAPLATTPPQVPDRYQSFLPGPTDPFESAIERKVPRRDGAAPRYRRHVIRDGDTLAGLAERYLGDPSRHNEILALNRQALRASDVLPIGTVLRIPPAPAAASGTSAASNSPSSSTSFPVAVPTIAPAPAEEPLVPVPAAEPTAAPVVSASTPVEPPIAVPASADNGWRPAP